MFRHLQTCPLFLLCQSSPGFISLLYYTYICTPAAPLRLSQGNVFPFFCLLSIRKCFVNYNQLTESFLLNPSSSSLSPDCSQCKVMPSYLQQLLKNLSHELAARTGLVMDPRRRRALPPAALLSWCMVSHIQNRIQTSVWLSPCAPSAVGTHLVC